MDDKSCTWVCRFILGIQRRFMRYFGLKAGYG